MLETFRADKNAKACVRLGTAFVFAHNERDAAMICFELNVFISHRTETGKSVVRPKRLSGTTESKYGDFFVEQDFEFRTACRRCCNCVVLVSCRMAPMIHQRVLRFFIKQK